ncbi:MAG TPA: hemolysin family protein [Halanaerobiales bacterium]|nr:hemolysin family protein [Halanaerobiales bacterium]
MYINLIGFVFLLILSGFFSGSETAFMSANRVRIRELANEGDKQAGRVDNLLEDQTKLLTTILIGNNLVNIAASAIATSIAINIFGSKGVGIATGFVTLVILVFGEITPKSLGNNSPIAYAKKASIILYWLEKILYPVILFFTILIKKMIGENKMISSAFISEEEVRRFVNVSEEEGAIKESEKEMIQSVFEFDDIVVKEIMVPRIDMVCISKDASINELVDLAVEKGHSRIPVYEESIDDIIGLIYVKDLLQLLQKGKENLTLEDLIKPIYFIPESKQINKLLKEMQNRREHMAVILDEYGGTSGLITIEDLLEEIVGDIQDEFDLEDKQINLINNKEILVDARVDLDDLNEILPTPLLDEESYETISGFVLHKLGYLPEEKETIELEGVTIEVEKIDEHRIQKLRIYTVEPIKKI